MLHICDIDTSEKICISFMSILILKDQTSPKFEAVNNNNKTQNTRFQIGFMFSFRPSGLLPD